MVCALLPVSCCVLSPFVKESECGALMVFPELDSPLFSSRLEKPPQFTRSRTVDLRLEGCPSSRKLPRRLRTSWYDVVPCIWPVAILLQRPPCLRVPQK